MWPIIPILEIERRDRIWGPKLLTERRPLSHTSACGTPAPGSLLFIGYKRKHLLLTPPLCCFLPAPKRFPLKLWCWESQTSLCPCPSQSSPHPFWVQHLCYNVKKHNLPSPPMGSPTRLSLPDLSYCNTMTLTRGVTHMIREQYSCCFLCYSSFLFVDWYSWYFRTLPGKLLLDWSLLRPSFHY